LSAAAADAFPDEVKMSQKVALVTGAGSGIGAAISRRLAKEGMAVCVLDVNGEPAAKVAAEIEAAGGKAIAVAASIARRDQMTAAVERVRAELGPVTVLVNNAGLSEILPFEELTDELWDRMFEVNVRGFFIPTQLVLPDMKAAGWGRIVNISSSSAQTGAVGMAHYSASKGAVIAMTRTLAQELGPLGITVNNIPPGSVQGTILYETTKDRFAIPLEQLIKAIPVRRFGEPEDIANACAWLVSEASGYVNGQTIGVNGGRVVS
jgi:2-hydroxycyclohexanecarboxyl-CoA dehydrogenase